MDARPRPGSGSDENSLHASARGQQSSPIPSADATSGMSRSRPELTATPGRSGLFRRASTSYCLHGYGVVSVAVRPETAEIVWPTALLLAPPQLHLSYMTGPSMSGLPVLRAQGPPCC